MLPPGTAMCRKKTRYGCCAGSQHVQLAAESGYKIQIRVQPCRGLRMQTCESLKKNVLRSDASPKTPPPPGRKRAAGLSRTVKSAEWAGGVYLPDPDGNPSYASYTPGSLAVPVDAPWERSAPRSHSRMRGFMHLRRAGAEVLRRAGQGSSCERR